MGAYTTVEKLSGMAQKQLSLNLAEVAPEAGDLDVNTRRLIDWAKVRCLVGVLLKAAIEGRPSNSDLRELL